MPQSSDSAKVISYRPSAFYFRRAIRGSTSVKEVKCVVCAVLDELEQLRTWALSQELAPAETCEYHERLSGCRVLADCKVIGLETVTALEDLKALARDHGVIPPKWRVLPEEAREKGWGA